MRRAICNVIMSAALCAGILGVFAAPAAAQDPKVAVTGGVDFTQPLHASAASARTQAKRRSGRSSIAGIPVFSGDGGLKSVTINVGTLERLSHGVDTVNRDGDRRATSGTSPTSMRRSGFGFGTACARRRPTPSYMSPGNYWHTSRSSCQAVVRRQRGARQRRAQAVRAGGVRTRTTDRADGGVQEGHLRRTRHRTRLRGVKASVAFPIKVGLSAKDYYEFVDGDDDEVRLLQRGRHRRTVPINSALERPRRRRTAAVRRPAAGLSTVRRLGRSPLCRIASSASVSRSRMASSPDEVL